MIYDNTFEEKPIKSIYAIGNLGYNVPEAQDIAKYIQGVEDRGYAKQKILKELLKRHAKKFGYVLRGYNSKTGRFNHIGGAFAQNRAVYDNKSNGERITGNVGAGVSDNDLKHDFDNLKYAVSDDFFDTRKNKVMNPLKPHE